MKKRKGHHWLMLVNPSYSQRVLHRLVQRQAKREREDRLRRWRRR